MLRLIVLIVLFSLSIPLRAHAAPDVVVTLRPLHSLVSAIMQGAGEPHLLLKAQQSPHHVQLRPKDVAMLHKADIIVWAGPTVESFLPDYLKALDKAPQIFALAEIEGIQRYRLRRLSGEESHHHEAGGVDGHLWLDPLNNSIIAEALAKLLIKLDPDNRELYLRNTNGLIDRLNDLHEYTQGQFKSVKQRTFIGFHDSLRYLEERYELHMVASVSVHPGEALQAAQLRHVKQVIQEESIHCVTYEPGSKREHITSLFAAPGINFTNIDVLGNDISPGPQHYFTMMRNVTDNLSRCLRRG